MKAARDKAPSRFNLGDENGKNNSYNNQILKGSWKSIQDYNVKEIYPAHGNSYTLC